MEQKRQAQAEPDYLLTGIQGCAAFVVLGLIVWIFLLSLTSGAQ
jgi:hypothetical protein